MKALAAGDWSGLLKYLDDSTLEVPIVLYC